MDRELKNVVQQILSEIPETETQLISELSDNLSSISCTAPELISMWWSEVHQTLISNIINTVPTKEWQFKVLSIFSLKSVDEIKTYFNDIKGG